MCRTLWMTWASLSIAVMFLKLFLLFFHYFVAVAVPLVVQNLCSSPSNVCLLQLFWKETLINKLSLIFTTVSLREVGAKRCLKKVEAGLSIIKTDLGKKTSRKDRVRASALIISRWFIKHSYTFHSQTCQSDLGTLFSSFDIQVFEAVWALRRSIITALSPFLNLFDEKKNSI